MAQRALIHKNTIKPCRNGKTFRCDGQSFWTPSKPLEMTPKGFGTMPKGFGNRSLPSVHEEKSEFDRVAHCSDRTKPRPQSVERRSDLAEPGVNPATPRRLSHEGKGALRSKRRNPLKKRQTA